MSVSIRILFPRGSAMEEYLESQEGGETLPFLAGVGDGADE